MIGVITNMHESEPIGTVRMELRRGPRGEAIAARGITVELMWPPVERTERYRNDCECREVYAVAAGDECRAVGAEEYAIAADWLREAAVQLRERAGRMAKKARTKRSIHMTVVSIAETRCVVGVLTESARLK